MEDITPAQRESLADNLTNAVAEGIIAKAQDPAASPASIAADPAEQDTPDSSGWTDDAPEDQAPPVPADYLRALVERGSMNVVALGVIVGDADVENVQRVAQSLEQQKLVERAGVGEYKATPAGFTQAAMRWNQ